MIKKERRWGSDKELLDHTPDLFEGVEVFVSTRESYAGGGTSL